jgi:molybdopterin adenylyltransferase
MNYTVAILTASDKGSIGEREDISGLELYKLLTNDKFTVISQKIVSDDREIISDTLIHFCDELKVDLVLTTGGTGFSPRDITPEATKDILHREALGIVEAMRLKSLEITDRAMLSRATAGIRNQTLIINMPGSPKAVKECFEVIRNVLPHALEILTGKGGECAR